MQGGIKHKPIYPDMKLYEEIIFLQYNFKGKYVIENVANFKGKYVIENVASYYKPLVRPYEINRHYFWSNFIIPNKEFKTLFIIREDSNEEKQRALGLDVSKYNGVDKTKILRNCVNPELGLYIFNCAFKTIQKEIVS